METYWYTKAGAPKQKQTRQIYLHHSKHRVLVHHGRSDQDWHTQDCGGW